MNGCQPPATVHSEVRLDRMLAAWMRGGLSGYLGDSWAGPPWDGDQVAMLALCLEMATACGLDVV